MSRLLVRNFSVSLDGYAAGPHQDLDHPLGIGGTQLHEWIFATRSGNQMIGREGGSEGLDNDFFAERGSGVGATIMGRNMFGPIRGPWGENEWTGWWGDEPPFHHPVFVLTHQPRAPIEMQGGTSFYFVDGGIEAALTSALEAAAGLDVLVGGGAATIRQYLRSSLIDENAYCDCACLAGWWRTILRRSRPQYRQLPLCRTRMFASRYSRPHRTGPW
jgi:dihydrofolate reductase